MKHIVALGLAAALIACSESPKPAAKAPPAAASAPVAAAPQAQPQPEPPKPDPNKELAAKVKQALEAPSAKLPSGAIDVTAAEGKVSL